jgi:hypothetical protein
MGVPAPKVGYTSATTGRGEHEVHDGHVVALDLKSYTYLLTYSTEQSPSWEANRFAASQEIPRILWDPKIVYRIHKCPPPVSILSQLNAVHPYPHILLPKYSP